MSSQTYKLGLSLSGGGYRAAGFHLGTLKKLNEMNILTEVDVISTISGGSITGAYYCLHKDDFAKFEKNLYEGLHEKNVIVNVLFSLTFLRFVVFCMIFLIPAFYSLFTESAWLFPVFFAIMIILLLKFQFLIFPVSKRIEHIYDKFFYQEKSLKELPDEPILVIGSTNLQTARAFTFSKKWMQDSTYQFMESPVKFNCSEFPISRAVIASSCVPFAFTPVKIDKEYFQNPEQTYKVHPLLVDGGVYDNQGIHKIVQKGTYKCSTIITSDAGGGTSGELKPRNTFSLLISTVDVFMARIKKAQLTQNVYENVGNENRQISYFSLAWDVENCISGFIDNLIKSQVLESVIIAHKLEDKWLLNPEEYREVIKGYLENRTGYNKIAKPSIKEKEIARSIGTNLTTLSKLQLDCLIKQAEALTELQVKLYCPSLIKNN